jgi:dTDP-4-dehydrorhamnose 3,5-epimerase
MDVQRFSEDGPVLINPKIFKDERGYFFESFNEKEFKEKVGNINFVQDNESRSSYGVVRGLHYQTGDYEQAKLVRVVKGAVADVAVDIREGSPNYGRYYFAYLSEKNHRQFFIPRGFAHGFVALEDDTVFQYKCDNFYNKESERAIFYADPTLGIPWGQWVNWGDIKVSPKDMKNPLMNDGKNEMDVDEQ